MQRPMCHSLHSRCRSGCSLRRIHSSRCSDGTRALGTGSSKKVATSRHTPIRGLRQLPRSRLPRLGRRPRSELSVKVCGLFGEVGHQRNSPIHRAAVPAAAPAEPHAESGAATGPAVVEQAAQSGPPRSPRVPRRFGICGEVGHRADSPLHHAPQALAADDAPDLSPELTPGPQQEAPAEDALWRALSAHDSAPVGGDKEEAEDPTPAVACARRRAADAVAAGARVRAKTIAPGKLTRAKRRAAELVVHPDDVHPWQEVQSRGSGGPREVA